MLTIGDCREWATTLAPGSVQTIVTSPPYFNLRDYGTATWEGGDPACEHQRDRKDRDERPRNGLTGGVATVAAQDSGSLAYRGTCGKCGALRVDKQMGLEQTPDEFVANLVALFRALRPALRDDGTLWLNLGDSYASSGTTDSSGNARLHQWNGDGAAARNGSQRRRLAGNQDVAKGRAPTPPGLKPKDLIGIPWLVAFALRADGWYLRSDIIWHKPNPMPESVKDRPTRSHEYLFLLSKGPRYYYDAEAIREPHAEASLERYQHGFTREKISGTGLVMADNYATVYGNPNGRNKRSVWTVTPAAFPGSHFATFPPELIRPCILAGTSAKGACVACGAPWRRVVERGEVIKVRGAGHTAAESGVYAGIGRTSSLLTGTQNTYRTTGWEPSCTCGTTETRPCVVADPFMGSGTVAQVAVEESRAWVGCDLDQRAREWTRARLDGRQVRLDLAVGAG